MYHIGTKKYSYSSQVSPARPLGLLSAPLRRPTDFSLLKVTEATLFSLSLLLLLSGSFIGGGKLHSIVTQSNVTPTELSEGSSHLVGADQSIVPTPGSDESSAVATSDNESTEEETVQTSSSPTVSTSVSDSAPEPLPRLLTGPKPATDTSVPTVNWAVNKLSGKTIFKGPHDPARDTATAWRSTRPSDAANLDKISAHAKGIWLTRGMSNIETYISGIVTSAKNAGQVPVFVVYGMPSVDCSGTGSTSHQNYMNWVESIDAAITTESIIVVEPDEIPLDKCGGAAERERETLLLSAVTTLKGANRHLYIDAGHSNWVGVTEAAARLKRSGITHTNGFALNVSNYETTASNTSYGNQLSAALGGAHFIIDTSRNGLGPNSTNEWCNAGGRALGEAPVTKGVSSKLDALLWIKYPGESDGTCNGGPSEGLWWPEYAVGLAQRSSL